MYTNLVSEIKDKGIVKIDNFLDKNEIDKISKIIKYYSAPKIPQIVIFLQTSKR